MDKKEFFEKFKQNIVGEEREELPRLNWLSLVSMTTDPDLAKHLGEFKLKNGDNVRFIKPPFYAMVMGRYYRIDRKIDNVLTRVSNIFLSKKDAVVNGKPYVKQPGDVMTMLLYGLIIEDGETFTEFIYPIKKSVLVEWIDFTGRIARKGLRPSDGILSVNTKKKEVQISEDSRIRSVKILVPDFDLLRDIEEFDINYDKLYAAAESYKEKIQKYVDIMNNRVVLEEEHAKPTTKTTLLSSNEVVIPEEEDDDVSFF